MDSTPSPCNVARESSTMTTVRGAGPQSHRVVSVSPHAHELEPEPEHPPCAIDVDCIAGDEAAQTLRGLTSDATNLAERLERALVQARDGGASAAKAVVQLQERLQLSAQMLKAFQSQISRVEMSLAELKSQEKKSQAAEARARERLGDLDRTVEAAMAKYTRRIDEALQAATVRFDKHVADHVGRAVPPQAAAGGDSSRRAEDELVRFTTTMQDLAQRIKELTEVSRASPGAGGGGAAAPAGATVNTADAAPPEVKVVPPLRFHTWVGTG